MDSWCTTTGVVSFWIIFQWVNIGVLCKSSSPFWVYFDSPVNYVGDTKMFKDENCRVVKSETNSSIKTNTNQPMLKQSVKSVALKSNKQTTVPVRFIPSIIHNES